jgi:hypothetical protein
MFVVEEDVVVAYVAVTWLATGEPNASTRLGKATTTAAIANK